MKVTFTKRRTFSVMCTSVTAAIGAMAVASTAHAQNLVIDATENPTSSPYTATTAASYSQIIIGDTGTGVLTDNSVLLTGTNVSSPTPSICLGNTSTGVGTLNLGDGGSLLSNTFDVGYNGSGSFIMTGGTCNTHSAGLLVGAAASSQGIFQMSGGTLYTATLYAGNGTSSTGTETVSGGTIIATAACDIGLTPARRVFSTHRADPLS